MLPNVVIGFVIHGHARLVKLILANGADCFRITMLDELLAMTFKTKGKLDK
jgi:hypothetical protein